MYPNLAYGLNVESLDVLVLDGNRGMQRIFAAVLMANRVRRVRTASNSIEALDDMIAVPPDLLIADWSTAPGDTEALIRTMRTPAMHPLCFVPAIALSDSISHAELETMLDAGVTTVLRKPVATRSLVSRIGWVTRDSRAYHLDGSRYKLPTPRPLRGNPSGAEARVMV
jgi:DNA-binding response OmpR family regulator